MYKYCTHCEKTIEPKRDVNWAIFVLLLCIGIIPALVYYYTRPQICPTCHTESWGPIPKKKKK